MAASAWPSAQNPVAALGLPVRHSPPLSIKLQGRRDPAGGGPRRLWLSVGRKSATGLKVIAVELAGPHRKYASAEQRGSRGGLLRTGLYW
ncbi:unnamed protein product [Boreogadus saida]